MPFNVEVNLNELPWQDPNMRENCLGELEKIASETTGFVQGWKYEIVAPTRHLIVQFERLDDALKYIAEIMNKQYVGRASVLNAGSPHKVMENYLPEN